jgi:competence protein ComEA
LSYERARELLQEAVHEAGGPKKVAAAGLVCVAVVVLAVGAYSRGGDDGPGAEVVAACGTGAATVGGIGQPAAGSGQAASSPPAGTAVEEASGTPRALLVHVAGAVRRPGLVRLEAGARVADAIRAAGGAASGADVSALNLAAVVADADKVYVPKRGEAQPEAVAGGGAALGPTSAGAAGSPVDLNAAGAAELDALPGIGPVLAQRIVDYRTSNGRFASVDDLRQVEGIGPKKFEQLKPLLVAH